MQKIMLIDAEEFIRKGIRTIIQRFYSSDTEIVEYSSGMEAYEVMSREEYDLIMIDIGIFSMDGFSMMKSIRDIRHMPKIVVLCRQKDFRLAVEGMKYGAKAYLPKPVLRNELISVLMEVEEEIKREEVMMSKFEMADRIYEEYKEDKINLLLSSQDPVENKAGLLSRFPELRKLSHHFYIAVFHFPEMYFFSEENCRNMKSVIQEYAQINDKGIEILCDISGQPFMLVEGGISASLILEHVKEKLGIDCIVGISDLHHSFGSLKDAYLQAKEAIKYRILCRSCEVIPYTLNKKTSRKLNYREHIRKVARMLGTKRNMDILAQLEKVFDLEQLEDFSMDEVEDIAGNIHTHILEHLIFNLPPKAQEIRSKLEELKDVYLFRHLEDYYEALCRAVTEANEYLIRENRDCKENDEIQKAIEYLNENYYKDLTLGMIANHTSFTYTYFSYLFKERTGQSFLDYLRHIRIEKAMILLRNTRLKVWEIGRKVGFANPKHFATVFRLVVGISPSEYRKKKI